MAKLLPTNTVNPQAPKLLAADTTTIAPASLACKVHLIIAPFTPGLTTDFTTLTEATFTGSAAKSAGTGTQQFFLDTTTGTFIVELLEPAGGWTWICTVAPAAPETVYGIVVTDNASAVTLGSLLLDTPVTVGAVNDGVVLDNLQFQFPANYIS